MDIAEIIKRAGGVAKLARAIGRHHATVLRWKRVPAEHARTVAQLAGVPRHELRPDIFDPPSQQREAA